MYTVNKFIVLFSHILQQNNINHKTSQPEHCCKMQIGGVRTPRLIVINLD